MALDLCWLRLLTNVIVMKPMHLAAGLAVVVAIAVSGCAGNSPNAAAPQKQAAAPDTRNCATGGGAAGTCVVGDRGPGGGIVFYVNEVNTPGSNYMEAAPNTWNGGTKDPSAAWCNDTNKLIPGSFKDPVDPSNTEKVFGTAMWTGKANTDSMVAACTSGAANKVRAYTGGLGAGSWSLPSRDEQKALYGQKGGVGGFAAAGYWSSSQFNPGSAWNLYADNGFQDFDFKRLTFLVRPVRAF